MERLESQSWVQPSAEEARFGVKFFKRFWKLCKLLFSSKCSQSVWLTVFLLLLSLLEQFVIYQIGLLPSKFYKIFTDKDSSDFISHVTLSLVLILVEAFLLSLKMYVASFLYIIWKRNLCNAIHDKYFTGITYYKLNVIDRTIDNPDQRVTQDVDHFCKSLSEILVPVIIIPFTICYYLYSCWEITSYLGPVSTLIFFVIFTTVNKLLMSPVAKYVYQQEKMEGNFRFRHVQIRLNAESAAFYHAEQVEKLKMNQKLEQLLSTQSWLIVWEFALNCSINLADYLGSILSYIVIAAPIFAGKYDHLAPGDLTALISQNGFYSIYLVNCFTKLLDQSLQMTDVIGNAHRICQLLEELQRIKDRESEEYNDPFSSIERHLQINGGGSTVEPEEQAFDVHNLTYSEPKSCKILCKNLTFQLCSGTNILVTGNSGCGKTSLLRILGGLWKPSSGHVYKNVDVGPSGMLYLPQKPYFTDGTLREQIVYPLMNCDVIPDDIKIERYLRFVRLSGLLDRLGGLDAKTDWNWYDELSPGEMQRLSFVRLFFQQSPFAILDEATSQVSEEMEQLLYKTCAELKITVMSVGHRSTIRAFHDMELHFNGKGGWTLSPIQS